MRAFLVAGIPTIIDAEPELARTLHDTPYHRVDLRLYRLPADSDSIVLTTGFGSLLQHTIRDMGDLCIQMIRVTCKAYAVELWGEWDRDPWAAFPVHGAELLDWIETRIAAAGGPRSMIRDFTDWADQPDMAIEAASTVRSGGRVLAASTLN